MAKAKRKPDLSFIAEGLRPLAVPVKDLYEDPDNAREHSDRNLQVIKDSLLRWGQRLPLIVRKSTMTVTAGNGRLRVAKELGWSHIAVLLCDDSEIEAKEFGLTDNQSAILANWNYEQLAMNLAELTEHIDLDEMTRIGFSSDELEVMLEADWSPPAVDPDAEFGRGEDESGKGTGAHSVTFELGDDDFAEYKDLMKQAKEKLEAKGAAQVVMQLLRQLQV